MKIRKIISLLLCFAMLLTFVGCGNKEENKSVISEKTSDVNIEYKVQYINEKVFEDGEVKIIYSQEELQTLLEKYRGCSGFVEACQKYDSSYFVNRLLVLKQCYMSSATHRTRVSSFIKDTDGKAHLKIELLTLGGEYAVTMAVGPRLHIIEPEAGFTLESVNDIVITEETVEVTLEELKKYY